MDEHNSLSMISFIERLEKKANRLLKDAQLQDWIEEVFQENLQYAHYPRTRISLCGRFNAGKSALINAMLQSKVVISRPISSTGVITRVYYSPTESYSLIKNINGNEEVLSFPVNQLKDVTVKDNFNKSQNVKDIKRVDIGLTNEFLKGNIELFDTPGLDDPDPRMSEITMNHLEHSDFIIFVIDALQLKDLNELLIKYYKRLGKNVIFVANKMDAIENEKDEQDIKDLARVYFADYYNPLTFNSDIFFVSAKSKDKNILDLASYFRTYILSNADKIAEVARLSILKNEIHEIYERIKTIIESKSDRVKKKILLDDKKIISSILIELEHRITTKQLS